MEKKNNTKNMTTNILLKFAKKGINLSPEAYQKIKNTKDPISTTSDIILKLKSENYKKEDLISVSGEIIDKYIKQEPKKEDTTQSLDTYTKKQTKEETVTKEFREEKQKREKEHKKQEQ